MIYKMLCVCMWSQGNHDEMNNHSEIKDSPSGGQPPVQWTNSMSPVATYFYRNGTFGTSKKQSLYSGKQTASVPPKDTNLYKIPPPPPTVQNCEHKINHLINWGCGQLVNRLDRNNQSSPQCVCSSDLWIIIIISLPEYENQKGREGSFCYPNYCFSLGFHYKG